jgi:hypothetical protein
MHTTVYSISESPKNAQLIWVGTDDGNVQLTQDGGKTWNNVAANVQGVGKNPWVTWVEASRFTDSTAYATFDRHMYGDMKPYVFKTTDFGKTWTPLKAQESGVRGYAHVIKEDTQNPNLLFLGTEFGLWISIDGGERWAQYKGSNFPNVAVRDIAIQPRTSDLVLATHGRGMWVVDNIAPLRALTPEVMTKEAVFLPIPPAIQYIDANGGWPDGDNSFSGPSRPEAAQIPYYQRSRHIFGDLKIEIFDSTGKLVDTVASSKKRGLNTTSWSMRMKAPLVPPAASAMFQAAIGPRIVPGTYKVKMTKGDKVYESEINVVLDPRAKYTVEDRKVQFALAQRLSNLLNHMSWSVDQIIGVRDAANQHAAKLGAADPLRKQLAALAADADKIRSKIVATKEGGAITGEERLREFLGTLYGDVNGYDGRPTDSQVARADVLQRELEDVIKEFQGITDKALPAINKQLAAKKAPPIQPISEKDWQAAHKDDQPSAAPAGMMLRERD